MDLLTCSHDTIYSKYSSFDSSEMFYSFILHIVTYLVFPRWWPGLPRHFTVHLVQGISPATTLTPFRAVCEAGWSAVLSRTSAQLSSLNWRECREKSFGNCVHLVSFYTHGPLPRISRANSAVCAAPHLTIVYYGVIYTRFQDCYAAVSTSNLSIVSNVAVASHWTECSRLESTLKASCYREFWKFICKYQAESTQFRNQIG